MEDYEIVELIAQGGYGIVLKALQKSTGQMVAIKQFRDSDSYSLRIAQREISVLKLLQGHPNIIKLLNSFQHNQKVFIVFELMNQTLLEMLQSSAEGKLDREQVRLIVYQMVKALAYMHSKNTVHRDIKPENMLLSRINSFNEQPRSKRMRGHSMELQSKLDNAKEQDESIFILKVCDLGQSREIISSDKENLTEYVSTRWYRAPELLIGSRIYEKSVDIWALGCMIPELISGKPLFPGKTNLEALIYIIRTLGNGLTKEQIQRFHENPEFQAYGKLPITKNVVTLEKRVPELNEEELDFVKNCLAFNPNDRMTAKQLLEHSYLKIDNSEILQNYELNFKSLNTEEHKQDNIQEIAEESENDSSLKQDLANQIRFETEQEEIQISRISQSLESETDQNNIYDTQKYLHQQKPKKIKKRPSSSGNQQQQESKQTGSRQSNNNLSSNINHQSEENYGQENNNLPTEQNLSESLNQQQQEKQLPKPILFLRKQKQAREQLKMNDQKLQEQKLFMESIGKQGFQSQVDNACPDNPFEMAADIQTASVVEPPNHVQQEQYFAHNRFSEPNNDIQRAHQGSNPISKINRDKVQFNQQPNQPRRDPIGFLNSSQKQKRFSDQIIQNEKQKNDQQSVQQQQPQQLYTIQKNKVLFANLKNQLPPGRSPPVKLNNPKLLIQNMNQIQRNQAQNQQQNPKFIDLKMNQHKLNPQQMAVRNTSVPVAQTQNDDHMKMTSESKFSKFVHSQIQDQSSSKSPSQLSFKQQDFLPQINNKDKFVPVNPPIQKQPSGKSSLLNTQKHISNKLQLPQLFNNPQQQVSATNLHQTQAQQDQSYRKSASIQSQQDNSKVQQQIPTLAARLGSSQASKDLMKQQPIQGRLPSRGLMNGESRANIQQISFSHSPPHNNHQQTMSDNWYGNNFIQSENKRQIIGINSKEKTTPSQIAHDAYNYINSPPKPMSRNSVHSKKANIQGSGLNIASNNTNGSNYYMISKNSLSKPPKR